MLAGYESFMGFNIVNSNNALDAAIKEFKKYVGRVNDPNEIVDEVFGTIGYSINDLTSTDKSTLIRTVQAMFR